MNWRAAAVVVIGIVNFNLVQVASTQCREVVGVENAEDVYKVRARGGGERDYGARVRVTCRIPYLREPDVRESECKPTGKWEPPVPQCVVAKCLIPVSEGLDVQIDEWYPKTDNETRVLRGTAATVSCEENYKVKTGRPGETECVENRKQHVWDPPPPVCEEITCDPIGQPSDNVTIEISPTDGIRPDNGRIKIGTIITFRCASDTFHLEGSETVTCNKTGTEARYSSDFPTCRALACPLPGPPLIVTVPPGSEVAPNKVSARTAVHFSCPEHHKIIGTSDAECTLSETFATPPPSCEEMLCLKPNWTGGEIYIPPDRMVGEDKVLLNTTVTFSCNQNYELVGEAEVTCVDSHTWNKDHLFCKDVSYRLLLWLLIQVPVLCIIIFLVSFVWNRFTHTKIGKMYDQIVLTGSVVGEVRLSFRHIHCCCLCGDDHTSEVTAAFFSDRVSTQCIRGETRWAIVNMLHSRRQDVVSLAYYAKDNGAYSFKVEPASMEKTLPLRGSVQVCRHRDRALFRFEMEGWGQGGDAGAARKLLSKDELHAFVERVRDEPAEETLPELPRWGKEYSRNHCPEGYLRCWRPAGWGEGRRLAVPTKARPDDLISTLTSSV